jgi:hypothetical protein
MFISSKKIKKFKKVVDKLRVCYYIYYIEKSKGVCVMLTREDRLLYSQKIIRQILTLAIFAMPDDPDAPHNLQYIDQYLEQKFMLKEYIELYGGHRVIL